MAPDFLIWQYPLSLLFLPFELHLTDNLNKTPGIMLFFYKIDGIYSNHTNEKQSNLAILPLAVVVFLQILLKYFTVWSNVNAKLRKSANFQKQIHFDCFCS